MMMFESMKAQNCDGVGPVIPPKRCRFDAPQIGAALEHETGKGNEFTGGQPIAPRVDELSSAEARTGPAVAGVPGLTLEQAHVVHGWLAASCGLPRERLGFIAVVATPSGRYRRRSYLTLAAAQHAVERAEARGVHAGLSMFEMRSVAAGDEAIESAIQPDRDTMKIDPDLPCQLRIPVECLDDLDRFAVGDPHGSVQGIRASRNGDGK
jgi:hypothetical protein